MVNEVDVYVAQQLRRYDGAVNVRKTAMEVAKDKMRGGEPRDAQSAVVAFYKKALRLGRTCKYMKIFLKSIYNISIIV